jgi:hypothetical protein
MAASTGPVLLAGGITLANEAFFAPLASPSALAKGTVRPWDGINWRVIPATGLAALALAGLEKVAPKFAVGLAWLSLATVFVVPLGNAPTPLDNALKALGYAGKKVG